MSSVNEIEAAISKLSRQELSDFRSWFVAFDAEAWDRQLEQDVAAGRLDALAEEALRDLREGRCTQLPCITAGDVLDRLGRVRVPKANPKLRAAMLAGRGRRSHGK
jgi:hypothetical protein